MATRQLRRRKKKNNKKKMTANQTSFVWALSVNSAHSTSRVAFADQKRKTYVYAVQISFVWALSINSAHYTNRDAHQLNLYWYGCPFTCGRL